MKTRIGNSPTPEGRNKSNPKATSPMKTRIDSPTKSFLNKSANLLSPNQSEQPRQGRNKNVSMSQSMQSFA